MAYIWINPVAESMYDSKALTEFLQKHDYKQVKVTVDWLNIVKEKYCMAVRETDNVVIDMRCPKTKDVLDELGVTSDVTTPVIEPILIHCAREISNRKDLQGEEKVITTPCQTLADMGNALNLSQTTFMPWNRFLLMVGDRPVEDSKLSASPIPPGFFEGLEMQTVSLSGEDEIKAYFQTNFLKDSTDDAQLVEMLFCKHGCHNGDGILATDALATPPTRERE